MFLLNFKPQSALEGIILLHLCVIFSGLIVAHGKLPTIQRRNGDPNLTQESAPKNAKDNLLSNTGGEEVSILTNPSGVAPVSDHQSAGTITSAGGDVTKPDSKVDPAAIPLPSITLPKPSSSSGSSSSLHDANGKALAFPIMDAEGHVVFQSASDIRPSSSLKAENTTKGVNLKVNSNATDWKGDQSAKKGAKAAAGNTLASIEKSLIGSISLGLIIILFT